jgi:ADP-heptose:LPS heptosyltransferase
MARRWFRLKIKMARWWSGRPNVMVFRLSGIGDIICMFPAVLTLRVKHPNARIFFITSREFASIVRMGRCADDVVEFGTGYSRVADELYDAVYRPLLGDELLPPEPVAYHLIDRFCDQLGVEVSDRQPRLWVSGTTSRRAGRALAAVRRDGSPVVAIHTGPSWPVREWNLEGWNRLVAMLTDECGAVVVQVGADVSTSSGAGRSSRAAGAIDWVGAWSLSELAAVIKSCHLFVGIDSGMLHIAGAVGTPSVGLFGAVDPKFRLHPETPSIGVTSDVPCLGCHHRTPKGHWESGCPNNIVCMQRLTARDVFAACMRLLGADASGQRTAQPRP